MRRSLPASTAHKESQDAYYTDYSCRRRFGSRRRDPRRLRNDSREIERRLHFAARNGLHPQERYDIERRIARLEQRLFRDARDGHRWDGQDRRYGSYDRDRDGRDDRWEDDRGTRH